MTKKVVVMNGDSNLAFKVKVEVWDKGYPEGSPDKLARTLDLLNPCDMTSEVYITSTRYLKVVEL